MSRRRRARRIRKLVDKERSLRPRAYDKNTRAAAVAERGEAAVIGGVALVVAASGNVRVDGLAPVLGVSWAPPPGALLRGEVASSTGRPRRRRSRAAGPAAARAASLHDSPDVHTARHARPSKNSSQSPLLVYVTLLFINAVYYGSLLAVARVVQLKEPDAHLAILLVCVCTRSAIHDILQPEPRPSRVLEVGALFCRDYTRRRGTQTPPPRSRS